MPKKENITSPDNINDKNNKNSSDEINLKVEQKSESDIKEGSENQNGKKKSDIEKDVTISSKTKIKSIENKNDEDLKSDENLSAEDKTDNTERKLLFENISLENDCESDNVLNNCSDIDNQFSNINSSDICDASGKPTCIEEENYTKIKYLGPEDTRSGNNEDSNSSSNQEEIFHEDRYSVRTLTSQDSHNTSINGNVNEFFQGSNFSNTFHPELTTESFSSPIEENELSEITLSTEDETPIYSNTFENQSNNNNIFDSSPQTIRFRTNRNIRNREYISSRISRDFDRPFINERSINNSIYRYMESERNIFTPYTSRLQFDHKNFYDSLDAFEGKYKNKFSGNSMLLNICESESDEDKESRHSRRLKRLNTHVAENETSVSNESSSYAEDDSSDFFMKPYACSNCSNNDVSDEKYKYREQNKENDMQKDVNHDEITDSDSEYLRQIYLWEYYRKYGKFAPEDTLNDHRSNNNSPNSNNFDCNYDNSTSETEEVAKIFKDFPDNQNKSEFNAISLKKQTWECSRTEDIEKTTKKVTAKEEKKKQENVETNQSDFNVPIHSMTWNNDIFEIATEPQNITEQNKEESEFCPELNEDSDYDAPDIDFDSEGEYYAGDDN